LEESLINLTPLIDVVFVVLISFILIAPLLEVDHVSLAQAGQTTESDLCRQSVLSIYVREDDSILLNHRLVTEKELKTLLQEKKKQYPEHVPQLFHDKDAKFGTYQKVKNAVEEAGFLQMDVILQQAH
jgi:biopolymer transport protein ExbD